MESGPGAVLVALRQGGEQLVGQLAGPGLRASAATGREALARLRADAPDVLVADVDAHELLADAAALGVPPQRVVAAPPDRLAEAVAALRSGADDVLVLPIRAAELEDAVARALERRRALGLARRLRPLARLAAVGRLAPALAHEITNPVAVLLASLDAALDGVEVMGRVEQVAVAGAEAAVLAWWHGEGREARDGAREALRDAAQASERLKTLAADLRVLSRAEPTASGTADVRRAALAALGLARPELTGRARLVADVPEGLVVHGGEGALALAVLHLLLRASESAAAGGARERQAVVRARREGETVTLEVQDDVEEAPPDELTVLLATALPEGAPSGPGALDLAVSYELVRELGGELRCRPRHGGGTVVEVRLRAHGSRGEP